MKLMKFYWLMLVFNTGTQSGFAHFCVICSSSENALCATHPQLLDGSECLDSDESKCYTKIQGNVTQRGCLSDLDEENVEKCLTDTDCETCDFESCNRGTFPKHRLQCYVGRITKTANYARKLQPCPIYEKDDRCVLGVFANGTTEHNCLSSLQVGSNEGDWRSCSQNACNYRPSSIKEHESTKPYDVPWVLITLIGIIIGIIAVSISKLLKRRKTNANIPETEALEVTVL